MDKPMGTIANAKITETYLGYEDHGILTCFITMNYDKSSNQSFGGYGLKYYGIEMIDNIISTVGVESYEDLIGEYCRIDHSNSKIYGIGNITEDEWYYPEHKENK